MQQRMDRIWRISAEIRHLYRLWRRRDLVDQAASGFAFDERKFDRVLDWRKPSYADVLFTIPLIGTNSSQGMPDPDHKIVPNLHDFTYDVYFYGSNLALSEVLEFDINQFFDGKGFIFGHQCEIAAGHQWDIWDNVNKHWDHTGIACNPISDGWNHLTLDVERTSDNQLLYKTITFNGNTEHAE